MLAKATELTSDFYKTHRFITLSMTNPDFIKKNGLEEYNFISNHGY